MSALPSDLVMLSRDGVLHKDTIAHLAQAGNSFIYQNADRALTSTTAAQKVFGQTANGRLTLEAGLYRIEFALYLTDMSATAGNALLDILGAGTAVIGNALLHAVGLDNNAPSSISARSGAGSLGDLTINLAGSGTGTGNLTTIHGAFTVTTAGTIIPSLALDTAAAANLRAGTHIILAKLGDTGVYSSGDAD